MDVIYLVVIIAISYSLTKKAIEEYKEKGIYISFKQNKVESKEDKIIRSIVMCIFCFAIISLNREVEHRIIFPLLGYYFLVSLTINMIAYRKYRDRAILEELGKITGLFLLFSVVIVIMIFL